MGMMPEHLDALHLSDFVLKHLAFLKMEERKDLRARKIIEAIVNYSGFGRDKFIPGSQIWPLNIDSELEHQYIVNKRMALELLDSFE